VAYVLTYENTIMEDNLKELDGIGTAREERLNEEGYTTYEELANADYEELSESIKRMPEDTALDLVVQAQNMADLKEAEVSTVDTLNQETETNSETVTEDNEEEEKENASESYFEITIPFSSPEQYDTFYHTLIEERCRLNRTNRTDAGNYEKVINELRTTSPSESVTVELTATELNDLHNAVLEQRMDYQGDNVIDYMEALRVVEEEINAAREEFLF